MRTAIADNAIACGRQCREAVCETWPGCSCPMLPPDGWGGGLPERAAFYERLTPVGWVTRDYWDGQHWRRDSWSTSVRWIDSRQRAPRGANGVICANQNLPWRLPQHAIVYGGGVRAGKTERLAVMNVREDMRRAA